MELLVAVIILILFFGAGSYWGYLQYGRRGAVIGPVGLALLVVVLLLLVRV